MTLPKEKKQARIMMHVCLVIAALSIIVCVMSIAMKVWPTAILMAIIGVLQYFSYKSWQKKA